MREEYWRGFFSGFCVAVLCMLAAIGIAILAR